MKKLYEKSEQTFAIVGIVIYCVLQSLANLLNEKIGIPYSASAVLCVLQAGILFGFVRRNGLMKRYGLCRSSVPARRFLYYLPLIVISTESLWYGVAFHDLGRTVCRLVMMPCVGFIEEMLFRGLLFKAMAKDNIKTAVIVSSVTFGMGHLVNSLNGNSESLASNLCQVVFAIAVGFLLVTVFYRGGSLLPCILTHAGINTLNTFANDTALTTQRLVIHCLILIVITVAYTLILLKTLPKVQGENEQS